MASFDWEQVVVVDVETTGLYTKDRVVELAIVELDSHCEPVRQWSTLMDCGRDIGPTHIHGITPSMCAGAPTFEDLAGTIASLLEGRIVVAHNSSFDSRFILAEFERFGASVEAEFACTMRAAQRASLPRGLSAACTEAGIAPWDHHSALGDAIATAKLLKIIAEHLDVSTAQPFISTPITPMRHGLRTTPRSSHQPIPRMPVFARLPTLHHPELRPDAVVYLDFLDRALADLLISEEEAEELKKISQQLGLTPAEVTQIETVWFNDLVGSIIADGIITASEAERMTLAATTLGIALPELALPVVPATHDTIELSGQVVVFTGSPTALLRGKPWTRTGAEALAAAAGATCAPSVTKKTTLVVAADCDTLSGKAKKARAAGILVISADEFASLINPAH